MWNRKASEIHARLVSSEAAFESQHPEEEPEQQLRIEHTTYDELHHPPSGRRTSTTNKDKHYISGLKSRGEKDTDDKNTRPNNLWNSNERRKSSISFPMPWISKERRNSTMFGSQTIPAGSSDPVVGKRLRKRGAILADTMTTQAPKKLVGLRKRGNNSQQPEDQTPSYNPSTPRKDNLYNVVKDKWHRRTSTTVPVLAERTRQEPSMDKIYTLRKRILDGKMERVTRPSSPSSFRTTRSPPRTPPRPPPTLSYNRPAPNLLHGAPPKSLKLLGVSGPTSMLSQSSIAGQYSESKDVRSISRDRKTKSSGSAFAMFLGGADALEQTRKGWQEKFKEPFEHLNYRSSRYSKEVETDGSETSFYCAGEEEVDKPSNNPTARKEIRKDISANNDKAWWDEDEDERCGVCGSSGVREPSNLCDGCEDEFVKRKENSRSRSQSRSLHPSPKTRLPLPEYRPTPPPKDSSTQPLFLETRIRDSLPTSHHHQTLKRSSMQHSKPVIPPKSPYRYSTASLVTPILQPKAYSPSSQFGDIEISNADHCFGDSPDRVEYGREMGMEGRVKEDEFDKAQTLFKRWSEAYGGDEGEEEKVERSRERSRERVRRDMEFYGYWDDLLHGGEEGRKDGFI